MAAVSRHRPVPGSERVPPRPPPPPLSGNGWKGAAGDSPVPVSGFPGDQVVLPCTYKGNAPISDLLVVWDTAKGENLHKFIAGNDDLTEQDPRFRNRTNLFKDQLGRGNWSVLISDLRESDQNQYICEIYKWTAVGYTWEQTDIIHLSVTERPQTPVPNTPVPDSGLSTGARVGLGIVILVFLAAIIGFVIRKWQRRNRRPLLSLEMNVGFGTFNPVKRFTQSVADPSDNPQVIVRVCLRLTRITDKLKDVAVHFPKDEWAELSEWEKIRYKNVKRNYEAMLAIEIRSFKPPFKNVDSKKPKKENIKKNQKSASSIASRSEEDENEGFGVSPDDTASATEETVSVKKINRETGVCTGNILVSANEQVTKETESRRYSLRKRERKVYTEERELCDDDYLFCENCETFFIEECPVHGPPVFIKDTVVEFSRSDRAHLTLPEGLSIATSKIRKAGLGVWNERKIIPKGVHFGPYEGVVSNEESAAVSGYSWMISKGKQDFEYIDAKDESKSNWMRFVNCARKEEEQNLVAFQHCGRIYYRTCKPVPPRCELLVWYGDEYAEELGIKWTAMWMAKQEPKCKDSDPNWEL
ncbi:histone-lysine N-methyltransferase PRDM7-like [Cetorhinus maximus]